MEKRIINTSNAPKAIGPYSQAVMIDGFLYISGQIPVDPGTASIVEGGIAQQAEMVMENLKAILKEAGMSMSNLVKVNVFVKDMGNFNIINEIYSRYFTDKFPARAFVEVSELPKSVMIEIEGIAHE